MFKIGEFSKLTQVSVRMLRYYDETGLLKPARVDEFTGYRLYIARQIPQLNRILFLRDVGFNVAEMALALQGWTDDFIIDQLCQKQLEVEETIKAEQARLSKIQLAKKDIGREMMAIHYNVSIKAVPACRVLSLRRVVENYYAEGRLWKELAVFAEENGISAAANTFTIYHDKDYREEAVDIEICLPVAALGEDADGFTFRHTQEVPAMASTMVYGHFENIAGAFRSFAGWLGEHNQYKMTGESRQVIHRGPWNEALAENYLTELQVPLERIEEA